MIRRTFVSFPSPMQAKVKPATDALSLISQNKATNVQQKAKSSSPLPPVGFTIPQVPVPPPASVILSLENEERALEEEEKALLKAKEAIQRKRKRNLEEKEEQTKRLCREKEAAEQRDAKEKLLPTYEREIAHKMWNLCLDYVIPDNDTFTDKRDLGATTLLSAAEKRVERLTLKAQTELVSRIATLVTWLRTTLGTIQAHHDYVSILQRAVTNEQAKLRLIAVEQAEREAAELARIALATEEAARLARENAQRAKTAADDLSLTSLMTDM